MMEFSNVFFVSTLLTHLKIASYGCSKNNAMDVLIAQSPAASNRNAPERSNEIRFKIFYIISLLKLILCETL